MAIPDSLFLRGDVPMTREEVRCLSLARLNVRPGDVVYDIGAGTGSVSVACALLAPAGKVYAFEKDPAAARLVAENAARFGVANVEVVRCEAPPEPWAPGVVDPPGVAVPVDCPGLAGRARIARVERPDRVFIGGSGDRIEAILEWVDGMIRPRGRLVLNCVTVETLAVGLSFIQTRGYADAGSLMASICTLRRLGGKHSYAGSNPVYIIWGERGDRDGRRDGRCG